VEGAALPRFGFQPDGAAEPVDDAAAERQPDAGAGDVLGGIQALEQLEYLVVVLGLDADAVVGHREVPQAVFRRNGTH
jgi:hypothetical protein